MHRLAARLVGLALTGLAVASLALAGPARAQTAWTMPTEYPETAIPGEGVALFARLVTERSGGRLKVEPSFDAALGLKSADMVAAVEAGRVQAADAFAGALGGTDPLFALSSLPFLATSVEDAERLDALARPAIEALLARHGQRLLYTTPWPPSGLWSKEPVDSLGALRSLRVRTYDATSTAVMAAAGATAVNLSFADAMPRIRAGEVNAVLSSGDGGAGRKLWDDLPNFTEVNYAVPVSLATVNAAALDALPADLRRVVKEAAAETGRRQWTVIRTRLAENYERMRANGVIIRTTPPADVVRALAAAAERPIEAWRARAGETGARLLDAFGRR